MPLKRRRTPIQRSFPYDKKEDKPPKQPRKTRKDICYICKTVSLTFLTPPPTPKSRHKSGFGRVSLHERQDAALTVHQTKTVLWRSNPDDDLEPGGVKTHLCNACGLWRAERGRHKTEAELARSLAKKKTIPASPDPAGSSDENDPVATSKEPKRRGHHPPPLLPASSSPGPSAACQEQESSSAISCAIAVDSRLSSLTPTLSAVSDMSVEGPEVGGGGDEDRRVEPDVIQGAISLLNLGQRMDPEDLVMIVNSTLGSHFQFALIARPMSLPFPKADLTPHLPQLPYQPFSPSSLLSPSRYSTFTHHREDYPDIHSYFQQYSPATASSSSSSSSSLSASSWAMTRKDYGHARGEARVNGRVRGQEGVPRSLPSMAFQASSSSGGGGAGRTIANDMRPTAVTPVFWSPQLPWGGRRRG
ncbi:hypothetical protein IAR50_006036 [Cryptococcus sp. DSM 104548]